MPKCGGRPASVVEKAIAWGSVTTARVRPMRRLARNAGTTCGSAAAALSAASLIGGIDVLHGVMTVTQAIGVCGERRQHRHHELLPRRRERPLLVARRSRQRADVVGDVAAVLIGEAAFTTWRHVAANEA